MFFFVLEKKTKIKNYIIHKIFENKSQNNTKRKKIHRIISKILTNNNFFAILFFSQNLNFLKYILSLNVIFLKFNLVFCFCCNIIHLFRILCK
jgi:hypothetical protein